MRTGGPPRVIPGREDRVALWRSGYAAGQASERRAVARDLATRDNRRTVGKMIDLCAQLLEVPMADEPTDLAHRLLVIAHREMPCTCLPDYINRGRIDPMCRHDDRDDLVASVVELVNRVRDERAGVDYPSAASREWGLGGDDR